MVENTFSSNDALLVTTVSRVCGSRFLSGNISPTSRWSDRDTRPWLSAPQPRQLDDVYHAHTSQTNQHYVGMPSSLMLQALAYLAFRRSAGPASNPARAPAPAHVDRHLHPRASACSPDFTVHFASALHRFAISHLVSASPWFSA